METVGRLLLLVNLLCCWFGLCSAQRLVVVVPSAIGITAANGEDHVNVSLAVIGGEDSQHEVSLQLQKAEDHTKTHSQTTVSVRQGTMMSVRLPLPADVLDRRSPTDGSVHLVVTCRTTTNRKESADLRIYLRTGFVFVQTDRPTYRRGDTVHIRTISTTEDMIPQGLATTLEVKDPENVTRVTHDVPEHNATYETSVVLHDEAPSGEWTISIFKHQPYHHRLSMAKFHVTTEVLNPFTLTLRVEDNIVTRDTTDINIHITAMESFGMPIIGQAEVTIDVVKDGRNMMIESLIGKLTDGKAQLSFALSKIYEIPRFTFDDIRGSGLEISAVITDDTGRFRKIVDRSVVFSEVYYQLELPQLSLTRHPDNDVYPLQVMLRLIDGSPASNTKVLVTYNGEDGEEGFTDESGYLYRELNRPTLIKVVAGDDNKNKVERSITIQESTEPEIRITPLRAEKKVGDDIYLSVFRPGSRKRWYYMVVARNRILQSGNTTRNGRLFHIESDMMPYVTVTVWAVYGNITVTHTATVTVTDTCDEKFKMAMLYDGQEVEDGDLVRPGSDVSLQFTGDYQQVALQAVDSLVYEHLQDADMKAREIQNALKERYQLEKPLVLGSKKIEEPKALGEPGKTSRKKRSTRVCPWTIQQCKRKGSRAQVTSVGQCLSNTHSVFSAGNCRSACVYAYYSFCKWKFQRFTRSPYRWSRGHARRRHVPHPVVQKEKRKPAEVGVRSDFRVSWLFETKTLTDKDWHTNRHQVAAVVPDSITRWQLTAVGLKEGHGICVATLNLTVRKRTFLKLHLPKTAKVGEVIDARVTIYRLASAYNRRKPRLRVDHPTGVCHNWGDETTTGQPWTTSWRLQPTQPGTFTIRVSYRGDRVSQTIYVKEAGSGTMNEDIADITSSSRILDPSEIYEISSPTSPNEDEDYEYPDYYEYYEYDEELYKDFAQIAARSQRDAGTNGDVHELHLKIRPKITMTKWNMSVELLTGFKADKESLQQLKDDHAYLKSYKEGDNVVVFSMDRIEKGSETDIKFLLMAAVNVQDQEDAKISIHHPTSTGPVVVHRYSMGNQRQVSQPVSCTV